MEVIITAPLVSDPTNPWTGKWILVLTGLLGDPANPGLTGERLTAPGFATYRMMELFVTMKNNYAKSQQGTFSSTETVFWGAAEVACEQCASLPFL